MNAKLIKEIKQEMSQPTRVETLLKIKKLYASLEKGGYNYLDEVLEIQEHIDCVIADCIEPHEEAKYINANNKDRY